MGWVSFSKNCTFAPIYPHLFVCYSVGNFSLQNLVLSPLFSISDDLSFPQILSPLQLTKHSANSFWYPHLRPTFMNTCPILNWYNHVTYFAYVLSPIDLGKGFLGGSSNPDFCQMGVCGLAGTFSLGVGLIPKAVVVSELQPGFYRNLLNWTKNGLNPT